MDDKDIPLVISQFREKLGLTQEKLAALLNVSFATLNRWENARSVPRGKSKRKIMDLIEKTEIEQPDSMKTDSGIRPVGKKRKKISKNDVLSTKSMEQMLWNAACSIRGEKDASKFKDYILPLVFIKRLSDVFEGEVDRLSLTYGDKATALSIIETDKTLVRFYIPPKHVGRSSVEEIRSNGRKTTSRRQWGNS